MKNEVSTPLYKINRDVSCIECGHRGVVQFYGDWKQNNDKNDRMSYAIGFGGTIPYNCTNCGNQGMIDIDGLEGYKKAFTTFESKGFYNEIHNLLEAKQKYKNAGDVFEMGEAADFMADTIDSVINILVRLDLKSAKQLGVFI